MTPIERELAEQSARFNEATAVVERSAIVFDGGEFQRVFLEVLGAHAAPDLAPHHSLIKG